MSEQRHILEQYLTARFSDKPGLMILRLDKIADGWESDNYALTVEYGNTHRTREDYVWRIYSGDGNRKKAVLEFNSMQKLFSAGYPVPRVFLLEADHSPIDRPFVIMEYIKGEVMWPLLDISSCKKRDSLLDQFCQQMILISSSINGWKRLAGQLKDFPILMLLCFWIG